MAGLHARGESGRNDDGSVDVLVDTFSVARDETRGLLRACRVHQVDAAVFREAAQHAVDERGSERSPVKVGDGIGRREVEVADGVEDEAEDDGQAKGGGDGEHIHRAVANALPQVFRRDDQCGPHA